MFRSIGAAALLAGSVVLCALPAHASVTPAQFTTDQAAGFQAFGGGWNFRYLQAEVTLPDISSASWQGAIPKGYGASLRLQNAGQVADLGISTCPSSACSSSGTAGASVPYNAAFALETGGHAFTCTNGTSPAVAAGDTVLLTLYYNYAGATGTLSYNVSDLTRTGHDFSGSCADPGQFFSTARIVAGFSADDNSPATGVSVPNGSQRLVEFTHTVVTNRTGIRGSAGVSGGWPVQRLALASGSTQLASAPFAWGKYATAPDSVVRDGRNFSVWMPSAA